MTTSPRKMTRKNVEALQLWSEGMNTVGMAKHLDCPERTVASRLNRARHTLGASHIGHAVAIAMASGLIAGPDPVAVVEVRDRYTRSLADFADTYKILRERGLTRQQIADQMGLKKKSVADQVTRARKVGLLPPWRNGAEAVPC